MTFILEECLKTTDETGKITQKWRKPDEVQVIAADGTKKFRVSGTEAYADSQAASQEGTITTVISHHVTCKELEFDRQEVGITLVNLIGKLNTYDLVIL